METAKQEKIMLAKNLSSSAKFGDKIIEGAVCLTVLEDEKVKKLIYEYEGRKYLNVKVVKRKEVSNYGKSHFMEIDQFVPRTQQTS